MEDGFFLLSSKSLEKEKAALVWDLERRVGVFSTRLWLGGSRVRVIGLLGAWPAPQGWGP